MNSIEIFETDLYPPDYELFTQYLTTILKWQPYSDSDKSIPTLPGRYVSFAMEYYLMNLKKHEDWIYEFLEYFMEHPHKINEFQSIKISNLEKITLEKFKTYVYDKYGTLEPFLGLELSLALTTYLEDEFLIGLEDNSYVLEDEETLLEGVYPI